MQHLVIFRFKPPTPQQPLVACPVSSLPRGGGGVNVCGTVCHTKRAFRTCSARSADTRGLKGGSHIPHTYQSLLPAAAVPAREHHGLPLAHGAAPEEHDRGRPTPLPLPEVGPGLEGGGTPVHPGQQKCNASGPAEVHPRTPPLGLMYWGGGGGGFRVWVYLVQRAKTFARCAESPSQCLRVSSGVGLHLRNGHSLSGTRWRERVAFVELRPHAKGPDIVS